MNIKIVSYQDAIACTELIEFNTSACWSLVLTFSLLVLPPFELHTEGRMRSDSKLTYWFKSIMALLPYLQFKISFNIFVATSFSLLWVTIKVRAPVDSAASSS